MLEFGLAFNVIVMMGTISLTLILAHFNRRLSWDVVKFSYFRPVVAIYLGLAILHSFASMWYARGDVSQTIFEYTLAAPLLWGFISTRPLKTIKNAIGSIQKPHSRLIGTAQWFFLVTGIMAIIPDFYPGKFTNITYVGFMFSCAVLSTWGSGIYLHQDHLHKSIHNRPGLWSIIIINAIGIMSLFLIGFKVTIFGDSSDLVYFFMRSLSLGAMIICIFILLIRDLFFSMDTWHRVPMSLDRYIS
jgi:predicted Co/Zn/Cd cation transporter (cation efflux family)